MTRRAIVSVLGAASLLAASVAGASSAAALASGATAPAQDFGSVKVYSATQKTVTVTANGGDVTFGATPTIAPIGTAVDQADDYSVVSNTCAGTTVPSGSTCSVVVGFRPSASGTRAANLSLPTTTPAETVLVGLTGVGVPDATGTYYALATPTRFLDTRTVGTKAPLARGATTSVQITGVAGIPSSGVSAVVINLTAVDTTAEGYFTVYPSGKTRPTASSINFPKAWTGANMVTVPVGDTDGKIRLYNYGGAAHAIVDVLGWYAKNDTVRAAKGMGAQFLSTGSGDPERIYDSRQDLPFVGGDYIEFKDTWTTPEAAAAVKAYAVTVTAVGATSTGYVTAWGGGTVTKPKASTLNYQKGVVAPNMAVVPAGHNSLSGEDNYGPNDTGFRLQNTGSGQVDLVVDVTGYYIADDLTGMRFTPLTGDAPKRILDTRNGTGLSGAFGAKQERNAPAGSVASVDSIYVVGNATGVKPTVQTYLTIWSGDNARPTASNLNVNPGLVRAVSAYAPLAYNSTTGALTYRIYNNAGSMHVLFDAAGTLDLYPTQAMLSASGPAAQGAAAPTTGRTPAGRTVTGADTLASRLDRSTHRRG